MHITVQTRYDIPYRTIHLSLCINTPIEPSFLALGHVLEYIIHQPQEYIIYLRENFQIK